MTSRPKVALSQDFLVNLSRLPPSIHSKVLKWTVQFQTHPTSPGINYEKIMKAVDPCLRSVRIDQDYRGIVFKPERDDVYVLLHVGRHDEAYQWAARRMMKVHPVTGALQILVVEESSVPAEAASTVSSPRLPEGEATTPVPPAPLPPLLETVTDEDLVYFGVPREVFGRVRAITALPELDTFRAELGVGPFEALSLLAVGFTVEEVRKDLETGARKPVDISDFATSLDNAESRSTFYVVENEAELAAVLNSPLSQWRIFLHPKQRRLANSDVNGPMRVLGGAGTGKTVLAMHRARWLAENRTGPDQRVLFTTFTRNLAGDIEANLETLCSRETMKKIQVLNLDRWVWTYLAGKRYEHRILYDLKGGARSEWDKALALRSGSLQQPDSFYEEEWEQVVAANGITTLDEYRTIRRVGRGGVLTRKQRDEIWPVFENFRHLLSVRKLKMVEDAYRDAALLLSQESGACPYSAIVVDETQDFGPMALRLLRQMAPPGKNDLFFVGDGHQRIYKRHRAAMSKCGINIVGRSRKLYLNYRTTEEIRAHATALLEGLSIDDLDEGLDSNTGYTSLSHGAAPTTLELNSPDEAMDQVARDARDLQDAPGDTLLSQCIIVPNHKIRVDLANVLARLNARVRLIDADTRDKADSDAIRVATMHRAKGLEFDRVTVLVEKQVLAGPECDETSRKLLYVALTRARREACIVTY